MPPATGLSYLEDTYKFQDQSGVCEVLQAPDGRTVVVLDRTIFYPQGGGQPADHGVIESAAGARFSVSDVRLVENAVWHYGVFESTAFSVGDPVKMTVDAERRRLNARLHSAGHLLDVAVKETGLPLTPGKGYHFPDSPYVEYEGEVPAEGRDKFVADLNEICKRLVADKRATEVFAAPKEKLAELCGFEADYIPDGTIARVVRVAGLACPCGGTHVQSTDEIGAMTVTKIKVKSGKTRVSYAVR